MVRGVACRAGQVLSKVAEGDAATVQAELAELLRLAGLPAGQVDRAAELLLQVRLSA